MYKFIYEKIQFLCFNYLVQSYLLSDKSFYTHWKTLDSTAAEKNLAHKLQNGAQHVVRGGNVKA